jgi:hypothetical protein
MIHCFGAVTPHALGSASMYYDQIYFMLEPLKPIDPYLNALRKSGYPPEYIELIIEHVQRFIKEKRLIFEYDAHPHYNVSNKTIILPPFDQLSDSNVAHLILVHELTHALGDFSNTEQSEYLSSMRAALLEEWLAKSSQNYGLAQAESENDDLRIYFPDLSVEDIKSLIEAIQFIKISQGLYKNLNTPMLYYTEAYNKAHGTQHQIPKNRFEPPMLPPTLARLAVKVFEKIPEDTLKEHEAWKSWELLTKINWATLKSASQATTWPVYPKSVEEMMSVFGNKDSLIEL